MDPKSVQSFEHINEQHTNLTCSFFKERNRVGSGPWPHGALFKGTCTACLLEAPGAGHEHGPAWIASASVPLPGMLQA
eukprot:scaffold274555_cov18-Tisochrysis_lutea.AAC.3